MALEAAEERGHRAVNPVNPIIRENRHAQAHAQRQAERQGSALSHFDDCARNANSIASTVPGYIAPGESIEVGDPDNELVVATDVSFPVADQTGNALADQLGKLNQLLEQGVLTAEEYAVAKTKLLI